jgi:hypothetical protein
VPGDARHRRAAKLVAAIRSQLPVEAVRRAADAPNPAVVQRSVVHVALCRAPDYSA